MRHTDTYIRIPLDEESARRKEPHPTGHNIHKKYTAMTPAEFEPAITGSERSQTNALDSAATRIG